MRRKVIAFRDNNLSESIDEFIERIESDIREGIYNIKLHKHNIEYLIEKYGENVIQRIFDGLKVILEKQENIQTKFIGNYYSIKYEERIQYIGDLIAWLDSISALELMPNLHLDNLSREELAKRFINARFDVEKIALLKRLFPLKDDKPIIVERQASYIGGIPHGAAQSGNDFYLLRVNNVQPGSYTDYTLVHEYLHIYLENQGLSIKVKTTNQRHKNFAFYIKNLVNDILIELLIINTFGERFSFNSVDLRKYVASHTLASSRLTVSLYLTIMTGGVSNQINFINFPYLIDHFDEIGEINADGEVKQITDIFIKIGTGLDNKKYLDLLESVLFHFTGARFTRRQEDEVSFDNLYKINEFIRNFEDELEEIMDLRNEIVQRFELDEGATDDEIKREFRKEFLRLHPDHAKDKYDKDAYLELDTLYRRWRSMFLD